MRFVFAPALFFLALAGCNPPTKQTASAPPPAPIAPIDPWLLTTRDATATEPALLWNGQIGVRLGRDATGAKLPFFTLDEYDTTGEEKIRTLDNPLTATFKVGEVALDPTKGTDYEQSLDMGNGILKTNWEQTIDGEPLQIEVQTVIHPQQRILADRWTFQSKKQIDIDGTIPTFGAVKSSKQNGNDNLRIQSLAEPSEMKVISDFHVSGGSGDLATHLSLTVDEVTFRGVAADGRPATFQRVISVGRSPNWISMMAARGIAYKMRADWDAPAPTPKFSDITRDSAKIWGDRWKTDIEIDGPKEDQQAVRSFLFYLRSAISPDGDMSISPMGLSNQQYYGHIFWDADLWVFPALAFVDPESAKAITDYRFKTAEGASTNFKSWIANGRPTGGSKLPKLDTQPSSEGVRMYAWESSVSGKETVPGPSQFEHHISGSVVLSARWAEALGLLDRSELSDITKGVAQFYINRLSGNGPYELLGTMSPDESHVGDNDLFTNILAQSVLDDAFWWKAPDKEKSKLVLKLPRDDRSFLTYDNDGLRSYKQAAAVLAIYPLQFEPAEKEAKVMMDRFSDKTIENGPAMSDSIHALIWARLGEKDKAYETWRHGWQPFTTHPLMLFSEKRKKAVTYFTTGAGGCLQTVIYGFLGFRIDGQKQQGSAWQTKLAGNSWLSIKPNLPPAWKSVKFKNFQVLGKPYTLTATQTEVKVDRG